MGGWAEGGTGVPCEAKRDPSSPVVNEEVMQSPDSPASRPRLAHSPAFIPICPHIVVDKWIKKCRGCVWACARARDASPHPLAPFCSVS